MVCPIQRKGGLIEKNIQIQLMPRRFKSISNNIAVALLTMILFWACSISKNNSGMSTRQSILRSAYPILTKVTRFFGTNNRILLSPSSATPPSSIYDIPFESIDGKHLSLSSFKGKKIIIVNTASDCGYTAQYEALQALYAKRKQDLVIVGFPANDFKKQEKGTNEEIAAFCKKNYGVDFPMAMKTTVIKSNDQHPLFRWLSDPASNGWNSVEPAWNFSKYVLDEEGRLIAYCDPSVDPMGSSFLKILENTKP
jgi:glutathione peroxidase